MRSDGLLTNASELVARADSKIRYFHPLALALSASLSRFGVKYRGAFVL